jgi:hypothetical protein
VSPDPSDFDSADVDAVTRRVVAGLAGDRNDTDARGAEAEGEDIAQELVLADLLEGADGCHVVSPWLSEPATIAVSMAINRPQAIDDAPAGPERSGGWRRSDFLGPREEWASQRPHALSCAGRRAQGKKVAPPPLQQGDRGAAVL